MEKRRREEEKEKRGREEEDEHRQDEQTEREWAKSPPEIIHSKEWLGG